MNGRQRANAALRTRPDREALFIAGYARNASVGSGHLSPGVAVITKPFPVEALATRVRKMIASGVLSRNIRQRSKGTKSHNNPVRSLGTMSGVRIELNPLRF